MEEAIEHIKKAMHWVLLNSSLWRPYILALIIECLLGLHLLVSAFVCWCLDGLGDVIGLIFNITTNAHKECPTGQLLFTQSTVLLLLCYCVAWTYQWWWHRNNAELLEPEKNGNESLLVNM